MSPIDIDALIEEAKQIPLLPASGVRLAALVSSHQYDIADVADVVAYDPALTLRLIRSANSAFQSSRTPVTTTRDAVLRLGAAQFLAISVASHARRLMQEDLPAYALSAGELWKHSVITAVVSELIPNHCTTVIPPETFTAALLHDIGKLVIARCVDEKTRKWLESAEQEGHLPLLQAEREVLEVDHAELGGLIAQHWKLPESVAKGITFHHTPDERKDVICDAVYLADTVAKQIEPAKTSRLPHPELNRRVLADLGLADSQFELLCQAGADKSQEASARFNAR
jgi:HD-like signal output (HDOD) protein